MGHPFSLCLFPASKRGALDCRTVEHVVQFDLANLPREWVYMNFDPFVGEWDIAGEFGFLTRPGTPKVYSDSIGFVIGTYFLAIDASLDDVVMPGLHNAPSEVHQRYHRYRRKRYYSPFTSLRPRRIWGVESPIELFLMQGTIHSGHVPVPQMHIYRDGTMYPSYYDMFQDEVFKSDNEVAATPDFYFPDKRVAVFCDSKHHRGTAKQAKDAEVSQRLVDMGIKPVRVTGRQIVHDFDDALATVLTAL